MPTERVIGFTGMRTVRAADDDDEGQPPGDGGGEYADGYYRLFWQAFVDDLSFNDVSQPEPRPTRYENLFLKMPGTSSIWLSAFFGRSTHRVGVYLRFRRQDDAADGVFRALEEERGTIEEELDLATQWTSDAKFHSISASHHFHDPTDDAVREEVKTWFAMALNRFVDVFRHRIARLLQAE